MTWRTSSPVTITTGPDEDVDAHEAGLQRVPEAGGAVVDGQALALAVLVAEGETVLALVAGEVGHDLDVAAAQPGLQGL